MAIHGIPTRLLSNILFLFLWILCLSFIVDVGNACRWMGGGKEMVRFLPTIIYHRLFYFNVKVVNVLYFIKCEFISVVMANNLSTLSS